MTCWSLNLSCCALSVSATAALLAACGGAQLPIDAPGAMPQIRTIAAHAERGRSWMAAGAKTKDLLYITNGMVDVYTYPEGQLEGQLSDISQPYGDCTDANGHVYITDIARNVVVEYAHGATQPIRTLGVPGTGPVSCAIDPASGDLAVASVGTVSGGGANVAIYRKAKGRPKTYTDPAILNYAFCTYDDAGNLFVDGSPARGYGYNFELAELPRRGKSFTAVNLQGGISFGAGLQWHGPDLAVGQPVTPRIWRFAVSNGYGTVVGSTALTSAYEARQFIIDRGKTIVVNEYIYDRYIFRWDVLVFDYPAGGDETQEIMESSTPVASVALSRRRH